jgi:ABC-type nickel/cobalt efflux system permease component RcnA
MKRFIRATGVASLLAILVPAVVSAHPLGNFTINHFAGLSVVGSNVNVDVIIDRAEIPTFQERQSIDTNGDGTVSPAEQEVSRLAACPTLAQSLTLTADGASLALNPAAAGISFPAGAGGLPTMRLVCEFVAALPSGATVLGFEDRSFAERIGWREIVFGADSAGVSARLTAYPQDLLAQPLDQRSAEIAVADVVVPAAWSAPDARPLAASAPAMEAPAVAAVPGGVGNELAAIVNARDLSPLVVLGSLFVAIVLGAAHAVSPGHGKTIMAAYLIGTRGTARQAIALGMTVTVSHTLGVMLLAVVTLVAASTLPPERLYPILGVASGALVIVIGGVLLLNRGRDLLAARRQRRDHDHGVAHDHGRDHGHEHGHVHHHEHGHSHSHPPAGGRLTWRGLFALGLSGGLVPSASALILLLGSISAGRIGYGLLLVVAFGVGMALVLGGVGLLLVHAARLAERLPQRRWLGTPMVAAQAATALLVVVLGVFLTGQALTQVL